MMLDTYIVLYFCLIITDIIGLIFSQKKKGKISTIDGFIFFSGIGYSTAHIILRLIGIG